jgi:hypothetical protein
MTMRAGPEEGVGRYPLNDAELHDSLSLSLSFSLSLSPQREKLVWIQAKVPPPKKRAPKKYLGFCQDSLHLNQKGEERNMIPTPMHQYTRA